MVVLGTVVVENIEDSEDVWLGTALVVFETLILVQDTKIIPRKNTN